MFLLLLMLAAPSSTSGSLYPRDSETRETKDLSGIWNFMLSPKNDPNLGFRENWFSKPLSESGNVEAMPVPSSYNDITQNASVRDHVGWAWYDTQFFVPQRWRQDKLRVVIRFGSVHYFASVWLNGISVVNHTGGHLPFQVDIEAYLKYSVPNRLTVAVNNTLTPETIPQGQITFTNDTAKYPPGYFYQSYSFDFFNYAGIHRPVIIYTTSVAYVDDISVQTSFSNESMATASFKVAVETSRPSGVDSSSDTLCQVTLYDKANSKVAQSTGLIGTLMVPNPKLWWPYLMSTDPGYLYTLEVSLMSSDKVVDVYRLPVGIRTVTWNQSTFFINGKPFYFRGLGKHEDSDIRGKGLDYPLIVKDFNLMKWLGANSFRTSHYPYAEEIMDLADREGIVVIDESPGVALDNFDEALLERHIAVMTELIQRDKNRPSVVMWSLANEPKSSKAHAGPYFKKLVELTKTLDTTRPVTAVLNAAYNKDQAAQYMDVLCVNRYFGWYEDTGHLDLIERQVKSEFSAWRSKFNKPVLISEYGADTIIGLHMNPPFVFSEDYQVAYMLEHFKAFDWLRQQGFFYGEMIWNFADFMTQQQTTRVVGNRKGIFTRSRQPKASAHVLRARYWHLAHSIDGFNGTGHSCTTYSQFHYWQPDEGSGECNEECKR